MHGAIGALKKAMARCYMRGVQKPLNQAAQNLSNTRLGMDNIYIAMAHLATKQGCGHA